MQTIYVGIEHISKFIDKSAKIFLVCGNSYDSLCIKDVIESLKVVKFVRFSDFTPNPTYEQVCKGVETFKSSNCDTILAVGGGSAMDVAKCIKLYATMSSDSDYIKQKIESNNIPFYAIPTTAGTGSEATHFAVIYYNGIKQSIADYSCIPQVVLFDPSVLETLPDYQRKATMLDAFCHAVESFWSVNSTDESKTYSKSAISLILNNMDSYLANEESGNATMLKAANLAGKAINITQTTAGHAMCYKITKLYGISHGHAAALCVSVLWHFMVENTSLCVDPRGERYLDGMFHELASVMGCPNALAGADKFLHIFAGLQLQTPELSGEGDLELLSKSVNLDRLKNNPVRLDEQTINALYRKIFGRK